MKTHKRKFLVISGICSLVLILSQCIDRTKSSNDPRGGEYIGSGKCVNCHKTIHSSYANTAHYKSTRAASKETVKGSFEPGANEYYYRPDVKVVMEQRDSSLFQVAYMNNVEKQANLFDIVVGSGRKAQTYLYWYDDKIYQLPVSYFVPANSWVNSPNYPPHQVRFDRNIPIGCFECHSSYIKVKSNEVVGQHIIDNFDKNKILYGIDCERCHGPAAKHVSFHEEHPKEKNPRDIAAYSSLSPLQKIDMCAQCHSGQQQTLKSTFYFKPGDTLINNFFAPSVSLNINEVDVHGNQKQLLMASRCFLKSKTLTCTSCHNTHINERDNKIEFSRRCMNCHNNINHNSSAMASLSEEAITSNCIDCHMPAKPSKLITLLSNGQAAPTPNLVRTHFIAIYPEETKKYISAMKHAFSK